MFLVQRETTPSLITSSNMLKKEGFAKLQEASGGSSLLLVTRKPTLLCRHRLLLAQLHEHLIAIAWWFRNLPISPFGPNQGTHEFCSWFSFFKGIFAGIPILRRNTKGICLFWASDRNITEPTAPFFKLFFKPKNH